MSSNGLNQRILDLLSISSSLAGKTSGSSFPCPVSGRRILRISPWLTLLKRIFRRSSTDEESILISERFVDQQLVVGSSLQNNLRSFNNMNKYLNEVKIKLSSRKSHLKYGTFKRHGRAAKNLLSFSSTLWVYCWERHIQILMLFIRNQMQSFSYWQIIII